MKKVLFVASVTRHLRAFHTPYLKWFKDQGFIVNAASNGDIQLEHCDKRYDVDIARSPLKMQNIKAYKKLKRIIEKNEYDIIHCHTPVAAIMTRFAARRARKKGTKVIYTAHGFHFYKGAPLLNWILYFPIEWICSFFTDCLITINREDFAFAQKHMHAKKIRYAHGVGVDVKIEPIDANRNDEKRKQLGIPEDAFLLLSVGELNKNKNHKTVISALASLNDTNIHYMIAGAGGAEESLAALAAELGVGSRVHLLGYRNDIFELTATADVFVFPSHREGLPVSVMEAMASGLACIVSDIRGNSDLIDDEKGGFLVKPDNVKAFAEKIKYLYENRQECLKMGEYNVEHVEEFSLPSVNREMAEIYLEVLNYDQSYDKRDRARV